MSGDGKIHVSDIGVIKMENGCCPDEPVYIQQVNTLSGEMLYNCHCKCGMWVTTAFKKPGDAVNEYERMTRSAK